MRRPNTNSKSDRLAAENATLRQRLEEVEETLRAIQSGDVDALVVDEGAGHRVYTLEGADRPYRVLVEQMHQGAVTLDDNGAILYSNPRFGEMVGRTEAELVGLMLAATIVPEDRALYQSLLHGLPSGPKQGEVSLRRRDGSVIPAFIAVNVLPRDSAAAVGVLITDLTAQKHQERLTAAYQALQMSETRFRALVETSAQIVWTADAQGAIVEDSPSWRAFTGQAYAEWMAEGWMAALHPDDRDRVVALWRDAVKAKAPIDTEYRLRHISGEWRWMSSRVALIRNPDGAAFGWVGMIADITESKHIQAQREEVLAMERHARAEAETANRMKDEFLATVSHELRTPLNAILGWSTMLRTGRVGSERAASALETIERNARAQNKLIEDLLDVSRIISGKVRLDIKPIDVLTPIEGAAGALQPAAEAKGVRIQKILEGGVCAVSGDADRLQQVIWNLLSNAIKFTPRGGRVQVRIERVNSHVVISVSDTGKGISRDFLPFVFDRFRQAESTITRASGGLGLGLAIVRHLVELHGGEVHAESPGEGQGANFTVKLPLINVYEPQTDEKRIQRGGNYGDLLPEIEYNDRLDGLKILAVDDDLDTGDLLKAMLEKCGARVTIVTSAQDALDLLSLSTFDLLVSDIGMPGMDGYELLQIIRQLPVEQGGKVPAVALTAYARIEDRLRALRAGYEMHVSKPIDYNELITVLSVAARRR